MILFIKKVRRRYVTQRAIVYSLVIGCMGLGIGTLINLMACFIPIYQSFFLSIMITIIVTIFGILFYGVFHFPNKKKMALIIDKRGLKERLTTSLELIEKSHLPAQSQCSMKELQLQDTIKAIETFPIKERFPFRFPKKPFGFFILAMLVFIIAAAIPSPKKSEAIKKHEIVKEVKNQIKKVEKTYEQVEKMNKLDKTLKNSLKKMLQDTKQELKKAESKEQVKKAMERLKTKTKQNLDSQRKKKNNQIWNTKNQELKKILNKSKSTNENKHTISKKMLEAMKKALEEQMKKPENAEEKEALQQELSKLESLDQIDDLEDLLESTLNYKENKDSKNNKPTEKKSKQGEGSDTGDGLGKGEGAGNGSGGKQGSGKGGDKNTGSKKGIEMENNKQENPEKVSIPGRKVGKDKNLSGKSNQGKSHKSKGGVGYGYKGESVDYNKVIGDYKKNAYSKLEKKEIPGDMEDVVKEYFEGIHEGE